MHKTGNVELGIQSYGKGTVHAPHYHLKATEINVVIEGKCRITKLGYKDLKWKPESIDLNSDDIFVVSPGETIKFEALTDCKIVCFKTNSYKNDKYLV